MDELAEVVFKASKGEATLHPQVASRVIQELHGRKKDENTLVVDLTKRETEILKVIARGMTNIEIAEKFVISKYTVKGHVSNILSKLHLADRTQAAVYAWQQGVVEKE